MKYLTLILLRHFQEEISSDKNLFIFRNVVGQVSLWIISIKSPRKVKLGRHQDSILSLAFSKQENLVVSGGHDGGVTIWDTISQRQVNQLQNVSDSPS